jgi:hypothetical protein
MTKMFNSKDALKEIIHTNLVCYSFRICHG